MKRIARDQARLWLILLRELAVEARRDWQRIPQWVEQARRHK